MGGQNSRMVREIVEDSLYIVRQTNRAAYERSKQSHEEVAAKLQELRALNQQLLHAEQSADTRAELFRSLEAVDAQKKQLDQVVDGFAKQFDLGDSYHKIADAHRVEKKAAAEAAEAAAATADSRSRQL